MKIESMDLKRMIKGKARFILNGCPRCENGMLYQYWKTEYHCMQCGYVVYGDLLDVYDPRIPTFLEERI